ncbi:MAG: hypothetical protein ACRCZK_01685 [Oscillospiraceae bacterium]
MIQPQSILEKIKSYNEIVDTDEWDNDILDYINASYVKLETEGLKHPTFNEEGKPNNSMYHDSYVVCVGYNVYLMMNSDVNYPVVWERYRNLIGTLRLWRFSEGNY